MGKIYSSCYCIGLQQCCELFTQLTRYKNHIASLKQEIRRLKSKISLLQNNQPAKQESYINNNKPTNQERHIRPQPVYQMPVNSPEDNEKDRQLDYLKGQVKSSNEEIQNLLKQRQALKLKLASKPRAAFDRNLDAFCQGEILNDDEEYKMFLVQTLEKRLNKRIRKTKHIFDSHPLNKNNLHEYVDGIPNILIILQIEETGYKIAAWTAKAFKQTIQQGDGLIVSLTNRIQFGKLAGKKAINYDETFLIFGNADLRFNNDTRSLYSNFGTAKSYYENKGYCVDKLIGKEQGQLKLKSYEIHQLQFG